MGGTTSTYEQESEVSTLPPPSSTSTPAPTPTPTYPPAQAPPMRIPRTAPTPISSPPTKGLRTGTTPISPPTHEPPTKLLRTAPMSVGKGERGLSRGNSTAQGMRVGAMNSYTVGASYGGTPPPVKVVVLGCASVGKASFVNRSVKGEKGGDKRSSTEIVFKTMLLKNSNVTFQIIMVNDDTFMNEHDIHDASGVFLMYDTTNRETFHAVETIYLPKLKRCCPYSLATVLIASKVDGWAEVTHEEGKLLALMNHIHFCEVSTQNNINMQKPFMIVAEAVAKIHGSQSI